MNLPYKTLWNQFGEILVNDYGMVCFYCAVPVFRTRYEDAPNKVTIDHVVPISKGGRTELSNLVICCKQCNQEKGSQDFLPFFRAKQKERLGRLAEAKSLVGKRK